jgi:hypothetical protein
MTEWLALALIVPAVVIPVVLLAGFAGCDKVFGLEGRFDEVIAIDSAQGTSASVIRLTWSYAADSPAIEFEFERLKPATGELQSFRALSSPFDDDNAGLGLDETTTYLYRVRAIRSDGEGGDWSGPNPNVPGTTLAFETAFAWTSDEDMQAQNLPGWQGQCGVQRIESVRLAKGGIRVKLTLRASRDNDASIDQLYISSADQQSGMDAWDSSADLTAVISSPTMVARNNRLTVGPVRYTLDPAKPLLIAIAFNPGVTSDVKAVPNTQTPPDQASVYFKPVPAQASQTDRDGDFQTSTFGLSFIEKIEVG